MESKYSNGKIYSIRSYQTDMIYIGSTCQELCNRLSQHRTNYKNYLLKKSRYISSFKLLEYDDYYIELIEEYPCDNKRQLNRREGDIIRQTENCINKCIAGRTNKEYKTDNKDKIKEFQKEYRENNKDKIKEYRENNKDKIKEYRENNKDKIKEFQKEYRENNKEIIKDQQTQPYACECGKTIRHYKKSVHFKTAYHLNKIKLIV